MREAVTEKSNEGMSQVKRRRKMTVKTDPKDLIPASDEEEENPVDEKKIGEEDHFMEIIMLYDSYYLMLLMQTLRTNFMLVPSASLDRIRVS